MIIPHKTSYLIRLYQNSLFHDTTTLQSERIYVFYLLLTPILGWLKETLSRYDLEKDEIESEIYIYSAKLFKKFNPEKSSIIPYLEKHIPWEAGHLIERFERKTDKEIPYSLINTKEKTYEIQEEFYWDAKKILFEDRYVGKIFTRAEKYIILNIIAADKLDLTKSNLARLCGLSRITMIEKLKELSQLEEIRQ